jgi:hypothetical protein
MCFCRSVVQTAGWRGLDVYGARMELLGALSFLRQPHARRPNWASTPKSRMVSFSCTRFVRVFGSSVSRRASASGSKRSSRYRSDLKASKFCRHCLHHQASSCSARVGRWGAGVAGCAADATGQAGLWCRHPIARHPRRTPAAQAPPKLSGATQVTVPSPMVVPPDALWFPFLRTSA